MALVDVVVGNPPSIQVGHKADEYATVSADLAVNIPAIGMIVIAVPLRYHCIRWRSQALMMVQRNETNRECRPIALRRGYLARVAVVTTVKASRHWVPRPGGPGDASLFGLVKRRRSLWLRVQNVVALMVLEGYHFGRRLRRRLRFPFVASLMLDVVSAVKVVSAIQCLAVTLVHR